MNHSIHSITVRNIRGEEISLGRYRGQTLLIVNVASRCGYTPQYKELQELHARYRERGLRVLAFPCNDFLGQEPGSEQEILEFCTKQFGVEFDLFAKVRILGPNAHPLYKMLQDLQLQQEGKRPLRLLPWITRLLLGLKGLPVPAPGGVQWNFHKYLINKDGVPIASFSTQTTPLDPALVQRIEDALR